MKAYLLQLLIPGGDPVGWVVGVIFIALMALMLVLMANWAGYNAPLDFHEGITGDDWRFLAEAFGTYLAWGTAQQIIVQAVFAALLLVLPRDAALVIAALVFGFMHAPNILLVFATAALGSMYCIHFSHWHNLWLLGVGHGFLATLLKWYYPTALTHNFRIWKAY